VKEGKFLSTKRLAGYAHVRGSLQDEELRDFGLIHSHTIREGCVAMTIWKAIFNIHSISKSSFTEIKISELNAQLKPL